MEFIASSLFQVLGQFLAKAPTYFVWLVGAVLVYQHRRGHPTSVRLYFLGLVIFFVSDLIFTPLILLLPQWVIEQGMSFAEVGSAVYAAGCVGQLISTVAWALVVAALYLPLRELAAQTGPDSR
jgi:hypothetical protein